MFSSPHASQRSSGRNLAEVWLRVLTKKLVPGVECDPLSACVHLGHRALQNYGAASRCVETCCRQVAGSSSECRSCKGVRGLSSSSSSSLPIKILSRRDACLVINASITTSPTTTTTTTTPTQTTQKLTLLSHTDTLLTLLTQTQLNQTHTPQTPHATHTTHTAHHVNKVLHGALESCTTTCAFPTIFHPHMRWLRASGGGGRGWASQGPCPGDRAGMAEF